MCGGHPHPPTPPTPHYHLPTPHTPRATRSPKHQNSISLELIEIFRFCLKILYLWTLLNSYRQWLVTLDTSHPPPPLYRAEETQIRKITISIEWIEIIQFCLKICDPWTLLHTYRLGLICRWGVSYPKWHFYILDPKKYIFFAPVTLQ